MNPNLASRGTEEAIKHTCREKKLISLESDKVDEDGVKMDGNIHGRLIIGHLLTKSAEKMKLCRFHQTQRSPKRDTEATERGVVLMKGLKCWP